MVFPWSFIDSKSPQVSRTLLSIVALLNNAVVLMVSTRPPTSKSSLSFNNSLLTVPKASISIGIIVTCMFHIFFQFPKKVEVLILLFTFFQFYSVISRDSKVDNFAISLSFFFFFFFVCTSSLRSGFSSGLKSSLYSSWFSRFCYLNGLNSFFDIQFSHSLFLVI